MLKFSQLVLRSSKNAVAFQNLTRLSTFPSASTAPAQSLSLENEVKPETPAPFTLKSSNAMITAAFAALKSEDETSEIKTPQTDAKLTSAQSVNDLLSISDGVGVSRKHALKVMSVLADWCASGKAKLADFEADSRFIRLCRVLTKGAYLKNQNQKITAKSEDLSTVMNVAADDEAAKLVGSISLGQMVKVFATLAQQKRRSTSLLRALAYNLSGVPQTLDIKQCGDVLYSAAVLNFYDSNLFEKVCADVCRGLTVDVKRSAVLGSIVTSLGLLRFKEIGILDNLTAWFLKNYNLCRQQDIFALFQTCAVLNYQSSALADLYKTLLPNLKQTETSNPVEWLDIVWSLVLLNLANADQISTVLNPDFVKVVVDFNTSGVATKLKLLNIDAFAGLLLKEYTGPRLETLQDLQLARSKEKEQIVSVVLDTLKNLMAEWCLQSNVNTRMGFLLDAECYLDKKCNPVALKKVADYPEKLIKVGVLVQDYHDFSRGRVEATGVNVLAIRLLEAQGYSVLTVPYTDFRVKDKLIRRVQYIESRLKEVVKNCN